MPTGVNSDSGDYQITLDLGEIEFFLIVGCCLCCIILFLVVRRRKAMQINTRLYDSAGQVQQIDSTHYSAEGNPVQTIETLHNSANNATDTEIQTVNSRYVVDKAMQANTTLNIVGESTRPEDEVVSNYRSDIRFALDKVSSGNDEVFSTKGGLEIGPQDSAL